ncbi:hypothetical protein P9480_09775 [Bacillus atrophaeus]|uniref:hypothetical protein n=1 Tax=Bacillus atrophaeus TaxID=1452 RepID=UPI002E1FF642|nr:hypothetical protein [Bacillus atrophaeus]
MVRLTLTQIYDDNLKPDYETILDDREVPPEEVANVLKEYADHPNNSDWGGIRQLIVSFREADEINVMLYNGYNE